MRINKFFMMMLAASFLLVACEKEDQAVTDLTLDKTELKLGVGETGTLVATVTPKGAAEVVWESTNTDVATVKDGVVTAVAEGSAIIAASAGIKTASCMVTVVKGSTNGENGEGNGNNDGDLHPSLQGSEYFIIQMDGISAGKIQSKIVADFRPDDNVKHFYIWESTYDAGATTGLNFYGEAEGWLSLTVTNVGWSGFGYFVDDLAGFNKLAAVMDAPDDYYLHLAIKTTDQAAHLFGLDGTAGNPKVALGGKFTDNDITYESYAALTRDGEWNEIEIPMSYFTDKGLSYGSNNTEGKNLFWGLSGGLSGTNLQLDAVFIYKK